MTTRLTSRSRDAMRSELCMNLSLQRKREQGMPGARCTRGLVCKMRRKRTRAYRYRRNTPAFPAQWLYGLCRALPGDEFVLSPSLTDLRLIEPGRVRLASAQLDTSNGCQDHTVLPYAAVYPRLRRAFGTRPAEALAKAESASFVLRALFTHGHRPANILARRRCRVHRNPSHVRDDGQRPSESGQDAAEFYF